MIDIIKSLVSLLVLEILGGDWSESFHSTCLSMKVFVLGFDAMYFFQCVHEEF